MFGFLDRLPGQSALIPTARPHPKQQHGHCIPRLRLLMRESKKTCSALLASNPASLSHSHCFSDGILEHGSRFASLSPRHLRQIKASVFSVFWFSVSGGRQRKHPSFPISVLFVRSRGSFRNPVSVGLANRPNLTATFLLMVLGIEPRA